MMRTKQRRFNQLLPAVGLCLAFLGAGPRAVEAGNSAVEKPVSALDLRLASGGSESPYIRKQLLDGAHLSLKVAAVGFEPAYLMEVLNGLAQNEVMGAFNPSLDYHAANLSEYKRIYEDRQIRLELVARVDVMRLPDDELDEFWHYLQFDRHKLSLSIGWPDGACNLALKELKEGGISRLPKGFLGHAWVVIGSQATKYQEEACILSGLLAALGIKVPGLTGEGSWQPERYQSLDDFQSLLAALYHPAVEQGMTLDEALAALRAAGALSSE